MFDRTHICRHEAAHFILGWITGTKPQRIAIRKKSGTVFMPDTLFLEWKIAIYAAGPIIDLEIEGLPPETFIPAYVCAADSNGKTDYCRICATLKKYDIPTEQWWSIISETVIQTAKALKDNKVFLDEIADFLNRHGSTDRRTTDALFQTLPRFSTNPIPGKNPIWKARFFLDFIEKK